jgi:hypothetical protein
MRLNSVFGVVSIAAFAFGGCASTPQGKSASSPVINSKVAKAVTAQDIIDRYKMAVYGKDGAMKHPSRTMKGTMAVEQFNVEGPFVSYSRAPDSNVANIEIMGMKVGTGCHKGVCWAQQPGGGTTTLSGDAAALQLQQSDFNQWDHIDRYYSSLEIVPPADGKESANYKIKATKKSGDPDYYDFSKDTGLLMEAVIQGETAQGRMKVGIQYRNYKDFEGMKIPTEMIQSTPQATIKLNINEVSFAPLTDEKFAKPE